MPSESVIKLRQVRGVGDVLNDTFLFIRQNYETLGKSLLFIVGPVAVLASVSGSVIQVIGFTFSPDVAGGGDVGPAVLSLAVLVAVVFGVAGAVLAVTVVTGCVMLYQDYGPGGFDVRDVWAMVRVHFWKILAALVLLGFLCGLSAVVVIIPCLGAVAWVVGIVYFGVNYAVLFPLLVREDIGLFDGMRRCMDLVRGYWWPTLGVFFVAGIVYLILGTLINLPYYVVLFVTGLHTVEMEGTGALHNLALVLTSVVSGLGGVLLYSIPLTALAFQYFSLVERKEHTGLLADIEALETGRDEAATASIPFRTPEAPGVPPYGPTDRAEGEDA